MRNFYYRPLAWLHRLRQAVLPSDMLLRMCRKHMRRFLISSRSSLSQRSTVLPSADAHWFWRGTKQRQEETMF